MKLSQYCNLVRIKLPDGNYRKFTEAEVEEIRQMEEMMEQGYQLELIKVRGGSRATWVKSDGSETQA